MYEMVFSDIKIIKKEFVNKKCNQAIGVLSVSYKSKGASIIYVTQKINFIQLHFHILMKRSSVFIFLF